MFILPTELFRGSNPLTQKIVSISTQLLLKVYLNPAVFLVTQVQIFSTKDSITERV